MSNIPAHLPGDLGEHDPRREAHPIGNEPGSGGHEVKIGSSEAKGLDSNATAAENSNNNDPRQDNTAEHAFEGASTESMDRAKRQQNAEVPGARTGDDGTSDHLTRPGVEQGSHRRAEYGNDAIDSGYTGSNTHHHHHHGSTGSGLTGGMTGGYSQSGTEPLSGVRGAGVGGAPYDAGNYQTSGFGGSDPQERHQIFHGDTHHPHDFSHNHNTRTGELLDPASGRDTGIPGYAGGASSGLTGSNTTGAGYGQTGSHTGTGLTGSSTTGAGYGQTGSTGERLREDLREGEYAVGHHGSTGTGLTGSSTTGAGYGQTGSTGERLREDLREGEYAAGHHGSTGSGLTGTTTGRHESTGERLRDDVREGEREHEHATGHNTSGTTEQHKKPSLMDKLNPMKDADGDGKKGFMK